MRPDRVAAVIEHVPELSRSQWLCGSRRTYGTPSFNFLEQGLKPLPIAFQSLQDETAKNLRICAKLQARGNAPGIEQPTIQG